MALPSLLTASGSLAASPLHKRTSDPATARHPSLSGLPAAGGQVQRYSVAGGRRLWTPVARTGLACSASPDPEGEAYVQVQGKEDRLAPSAEGEAASSSGRRPEEAPGIPYTLVMGLGAAGLAETVYLSWAKLNGSSPLCLVGGDGCTSVLNSAYASLMGLPLPFYGVVAYGLVAALAGLGATGVAKEEKGAERLLEDGLIAGSSALISTSAVLMYVLATRLGGEPCPWCLASAGLSTGIAGLVASGFSAEQLCQRVAPLAAAASASVVLTLSTAFSGISANAAGGGNSISLPYDQPEVRTHSSEEAVAVAHRLKAAGAKMYGAFWCSHCFAQKEYFGQEAMADFPYVECFPQGFYRSEDGTATKIDKACSDMAIKGFPTWVVNGQKYEGEQSLADLEEEMAANME